MKNLKIKEQNFLTLDEGCSRYLDNCRARNLREGTINYYRQSYVQFAKFFDMKMPVSEIDEKLYQKYVVFLRETLNNDISINSYLRDFCIFRAARAPQTAADVHRNRADCAPPPRTLCIEKARTNRLPPRLFHRLSGAKRRRSLW